MNLKKGITLIFVANIINMGFSLIINFLLPKYLTIDAYAGIKSFQLYTGYVGMLHLGYADGMYLKYGGKRLNQIERHDLQNDIGTMRVFQFLITLGVIVFCVFSRDIVLITSSLVILPLNMTSYYRSLFQAAGEFDTYASVMNTTAFSTFAVNIILLLAHIYSGYQYYLISYVLIDIVIWVLLEYILSKRCSVKFTLGFNIRIFQSNISNGILLMLGNTSSMMLTGMDRWFIKVLMDNTAFAQYSFAVSVENMINVAITPISTTLYNYFCNNQEPDKIKSLRGKVVIVATGVVACAFPARLIIEYFLPQYLMSVSVIFILFAAQIFFIVIRCVYTNLYKAQKRQKTYFVKLVVVLVFGFCINAGLYFLLSKKEVFAVGTMLCGIFWIVLCDKDFGSIPLDWKTSIYLVTETTVFIICGTYLEAIIGGFIYTVTSVALAKLLMGRDFTELIKIVKETILQMRNHHVE